MIKEVKNTVPWTYFINNLNGEEIIETFYGKELQITNQQKFEIEKVIKRKGNKPYVKWKGMKILLIAGLIKKMLNEILLNAMPLYKNESIFS